MKHITSKSAPRCDPQNLVTVKSGQRPFARRWRRRAGGGSRSAVKAEDIRKDKDGLRRVQGAQEGQTITMGIERWLRLTSERPAPKC